MKTLKWPFRIFALMVGFLMTVPLSAQDEGSDIGSISTDRPLQSEATTTVPKRYLQFENGAHYERSNKLGAYEIVGPVNTFSIPNMQLRYGITDYLEARLLVNYLQIEQTTDIDPKTSDGGESPLVGLKVRILKESEEVPAMALSVQSRVAAWGRESYQPDVANIVYRLGTSKQLLDFWYVLASVSGVWADADFQVFGGYTFQTGITVNENLTFMAEYYGLFGRWADNNHALNAGIAIQLNDNNQLDFSSGLGLENNFYDYYLDIGYSFRFGL